MERLEQLKRTIVADGRLSSADVQLLRKALMEDGEITRTKANFLFNLKDTINKEYHTSEFKELFVDFFTKYLIEDEDSPGEIDEKQDFRVVD